MQINLLKNVHLSLLKCFINEQVKKPSLNYMRLAFINYMRLAFMRLDQTDKFRYDENLKK